MCACLSRVRTQRSHSVIESCGLTPELSRTALRPWASENYQSLHEAAKRSRLERIVRAHLRETSQKTVAAAAPHAPMNRTASRYCNHPAVVGEPSTSVATPLTLEDARRSEYWSGQEDTAIGNDPKTKPAGIVVHQRTAFRQ